MKSSTAGKSSAGIVLAIVCLSMYLNIENVLSLMLYDMTVAFPDVSAFTIQKLPANMYLIEAVTSLGIGWLASKMSKRKMIIIFQGGTVLGALIGYFFGSSFSMVYFSLFILSISCAVTSTIARSVVVESFASKDVPKMISVSQISNSLGTALLQILGGHLIAISWRTGYLAFLTGLFSLFSALFLLPEGPLEKREKSGETGMKSKIWTKHLIHDVVLTLLFLCINSTYTTYITFLVTERGFGNAVAAGYLSGVKTGFTFLAACVLPFTVKQLKKHIISASMLLILIGYGMVAAASNIWFVLIGAALSGFGIGTFTPAIFTHIAKHVTPETNSSSHAMIAVAGTLGNYLYPYLITLPSLALGESSTYKFVIAMIWCALVLAGEILFQRKEKEY